MLVLSRRLQQSVLIGGRIKVTVVNITNSYVELGIEAPAHIAVDREEVHLRKLAEKSAVRIVRPAPVTTGAASSASGRGQGAGRQQGGRPAEPLQTDAREPAPAHISRRRRDR